jgi:glycosyltransferase involved in cell wall biosynthesis
LVGIALLTLVPGELGGSETYVRELLRALARNGQLEYRVYVPPAAPGAGEGLSEEVVEEYRRARTRRERLVAVAAATARPAAIRRRVRGDVVHYPLTIRIPRGVAPSVVTLHDLQHLDLPRLFPRAERVFRAVAYHRSVRSATAVIVPSAFVRDRTAELLGIDASRVRSIHHGIDHTVFSPGLDEREPFVIYPARPWPHKNHARLFEAWSLLRRERAGLKLVLTGGGRFDSVPEGVEIRGLVPRDELVSLLRRASALVFPSLYEGFGQPPLEAMACGCPVACSDAASLPEVCGDAARYFHPDDPRQIASAVLDVLAAPETWSRRGLARAQAFTWERAARAHEDVYRELSTRS